MIPIDLKFQVLSRLIQMLKPYLNGAEQQACSLYMKNLFTPPPLEARFDHDVEILQALCVSAKEGRYDSPEQEKKKPLDLNRVKKEVTKLEGLSPLKAPEATSSNSLPMHEVKKEKIPSSLPRMSSLSHSMPECLTEEVKAIVKEIPLALEWVKQIALHEHAPLVLRTFLSALEEHPEQEHPIVHFVAPLSPLKTLGGSIPFCRTKERSVSMVQERHTTQKLTTDPRRVFAEKSLGNIAESKNTICSCSSRVEAAVTLEDASPLQKGESSKINTFNAPPFAVPFFYTVLSSLLKTLKGKKRKERRSYPHEEEELRD